MINQLIILLISLSLVLSACGGEEEKQTAQQKTSRPAKTQKAETKPEATAEATAEPVYAYYPEGKRDPFESPLLKQKFADGEGAPLAPLQQFDVTQLVLTGVIVGLEAPKAMVKAPDGKAYILSIGTLVGKNGGKVVNITNDGVAVEEILEDFSGDVRVNEVMIALPKRKGV